MFHLVGVDYRAALASDWWFISVHTNKLEYPHISSSLLFVCYLISNVSLPIDNHANLRDSPCVCDANVCPTFVAARRAGVIFSTSSDIRACNLRDMSTPLPTALTHHPIGPVVYLLVSQCACGSVAYRFCMIANLEVVVHREKAAPGLRTDDHWYPVRCVESRNIGLK